MNSSERTDPLGQVAKSGLDGHRDRLRERFRKGGLTGFLDYEILELLLTYAIPQKDVEPVAKALLSEFGNNLAAVYDAPAEALKRVAGIGDQAVVLIRIIPRLFDSYKLSRWGGQITVTSTQSLVAFLSSLLGTERNEVFCVLALDSQNRLIAVERIQKGSVNRMAVCPRLVVEASLKHRATAVILAHNHPGGGPQPSAADRQLTSRLKKILGDLDIVVHDHIIIAGPDRYFSFALTGRLEYVTADSPTPYAAPISLNSISSRHRPAIYGQTVHRSADGLQRRSVRKLPRRGQLPIGMRLF